MLRAVLWRPSRGFAGLCDRLRSLAAMRYLASCLIAEKLVVYWPLNDACPFRLSEVTGDKMLVEYDSEEPPEGYRYIETFGHDANAWWNVYVEGWPWLFHCYHAFSTIVSGELQDMMKASPFVPVFDAWAERVGFGSNTVGIHLRRTDNVRDNDRIDSLATVSELDALMLREIERVIADKPDTVFFLATDARSYARQWPCLILHRGGNVLSYPKDFNESRLRQTSLEGLMCDIIGLSKCERVLCSCSSSILLVVQRIHRMPEILEIK